MRFENREKESQDRGISRGERKKKKEKRKKVKVKRKKGRCVLRTILTRLRRKKKEQKRETSPYSLNDSAIPSMVQID